MAALAPWVGGNNQVPSYGQSQGELETIQVTVTSYPANLGPDWTTSGTAAIAVQDQLPRDTPEAATVMVEKEEIVGPGIDPSTQGTQRGVQVVGRDTGPYGDIPTVDLQSTICSYPWPCDQALSVSYCESTGDIWAKSPGGHLGLFQLAQSHAAPYGYAVSELLDPAVNTFVAWSIYHRDGDSWMEWSCQP